MIGAYIKRRFIVEFATPSPPIAAGVMAGFGPWAAACGMVALGVDSASPEYRQHPLLGTTYGLRANRSQGGVGKDCAGESKNAVETPRSTLPGAGRRGLRHRCRSPNTLKPSVL